MWCLIFKVDLLRLRELKHNGAVYWENVRQIASSASSANVKRKSVAFADGDEVWDDYKTSVMLRLSRGGVPSPESLEAARITGLLCDMMAGPAARRRSAVAKMAANGLKL